MAQILSSAMSGFIPTSVANNIVADVTRGSSVMRLGQTVPMTTPEKTVPVMTAGPGAYWVGEGAAITTAGATWIFPKLVAKKIATIIPVSNEVLKYNTVDAFAELQPRIAEAFAVAFDQAALFGTASPYGVGASIFEKVTTASNLFENKSVADQEIGGDLSDMMALVEADGYDVNAFACPTAMKNSLRKAKDDLGNALFKDISKDAPAELYGQPLAYVRNGAWDSTKALAIGGNFDYCLVGVLQGIEYKISEDATINSAGTPINLFEQDMSALRATMSIGFLVVKDGAFAALTPYTA